MVHDVVFTKDNLDEFERLKLETTFQFCKFEGIRLGDTVSKIYQNCVFKDCDWKETDVDEKNREKTRASNLSRTVMTGCLVMNSDLSGVQGYDFSAIDTDFVDSNLSKSVLLGVSLERGSLENCKVDKMVLDGKISGVSFRGLSGKAFADNCIFEVDDKQFLSQHNMSAYVSMVQREVNKHVLYVNSLNSSMKPWSGANARNLMAQYKVANESEYRRLRALDTGKKIQAYLDHLGVAFEKKTREVIKTSGSLMGLTTEEEKKAYLANRKREYLEAVRRDIQESFAFIGKYNTSDKRLAYINSKARELYSSRESDNLGEHREAADLAYKDESLKALSGRVTQRTRNSKTWKEAEEKVLGYRRDDRRQQAVDTAAYMVEVYARQPMRDEKGNVVTDGKGNVKYEFIKDEFGNYVPRRHYNARDRRHVVEQEKKTSREREDMTHSQEVTDYRERRSMYLNEIRVAKDKVRQAKTVVNKVAKGQYDALEPFEYRLSVRKDAKNPCFIHQMMDAAVDGDSQQLMGFVNLIDKHLQTSGIHSKTMESSLNSSQKDALKIGSYKQSLSRVLASNALDNVAPDGRDGAVHIPCGAFRLGEEKFSVDAVTVGEKYQFTVKGFCKKDTVDKVRQFLLDDELFHGMSLGIVKQDANALKNEKQAILADAREGLKSSINRFKTFKSDSSISGKKDAEELNKIVAVESGVLDYSGDAEQYDRYGNPYSNKSGKSSGRGSVSGRSFSGTARKGGFSYRLYMSAGATSDPSQLYPVLDEIEEGKVGLLSSKAEKLDAIVGQTLSGFEKVSGLSVMKGEADTYGLMGRYRNGSDLVSVFAKTDNAAGNGYYEVTGYCDANHLSEVVYMVKHAELFEGLTAYNGLPTKANNLGQNDGALRASEVVKEADRSDVSRLDDTPVVDFSDVGNRNGGKGKGRA